MALYPVLGNFEHDRVPYRRGEEVVFEVVPAGVAHLLGPALPDSEKISKLNLNTATKAQIIELKHIGSVTAEKILAGIPFANLNDALAASGLKPNQWEEIVDRVEV